MGRISGCSIGAGLAPTIAWTIGGDGATAGTIGGQADEQQETAAWD